MECVKCRLIDGDKWVLGYYVFHTLVLHITSDVDINIYQLQLEPLVYG